VIFIVTIFKVSEMAFCPISLFWGEGGEFKGVMVEKI
jgi:hypothetical protein